LIVSQFITLYVTRRFISIFRTSRNGCSTARAFFDRAESSRNLRPRRLRPFRVPCCRPEGNGNGNVTIDPERNHADVSRGRGSRRAVLLFDVACGRPSAVRATPNGRKPDNRAVLDWRLLRTGGTPVPRRASRRSGPAGFRGELRPGGSLAFLGMFPDDPAPSPVSAADPPATIPA